MLRDDFDDIQHVGIPTTDLAATEAFWTSLGFEKAGQFDNDGIKDSIIFMKKGHLIVESWIDQTTSHETGAINHISLNTPDAEKAFADAEAEGFKMLEDEVQSLAFWDNGSKYFNIQGPNNEKVEFCEIIK